MFRRRLIENDPLVVRDHSPPTMLSGSGHGLGINFGGGGIKRDKDKNYG
jgi:hypothetical protein